MQERVKSEDTRFRLESERFLKFIFLISPTQAEVFKDLIGQLKKINTHSDAEFLLVSKDEFLSWNEILCKVIILASFSKINQEWFYKQKYWDNASYLIGYIDNLYKYLYRY